jgi:hypothetical protein
MDKAAAIVKVKIGIIDNPNETSLFNYIAHEDDIGISQDSPYFLPSKFVLVRYYDRLSFNSNKRNII